MKKKAKIGIVISTLIIIGAIFTVMILLTPGPSNFFPFMPSTQISSKNPFVYVENSTIKNNTYAIRIDDGNTIVENALNLVDNKLNGTLVINSTILKNSVPQNESRLVRINLFGTAKLTMKNITDTRLNIYLFDNAELSLENCNINSTIALNSSTVYLKNSTATIVSDFYTAGILIMPTIVSIISVPSSSINILQNSNVTQVGIIGANLLVNNSTIGMLQMAGISKQAEIKNSTVNMLTLSVNATLSVYGSQISLASISMLANLIINASTVLSLSYGIICYTGTTNIINGIPSGSGYTNNTILYGTTPLISNLTSIAANNSAYAYIEWSLATSFNLYLYSSASALINNTKAATSSTNIFLYIFENSQLTIKNSNISAGGILSGVSASDNSQLTIKNASLPILITGINSRLTMENSTAMMLMIATLGSVSINNSTITMLMIMISSTGSPVGNITVTNTTITTATVYGSTVITFRGCTIMSLSAGIVIYTGSFTLNSTGLIGSGSYTNYTQVITSSILLKQTSYFEINNSATLNVTNITTTNTIIQSLNAIVTLNNASISSITMFNNSQTLIHNSTVTTMEIMGNSNLVIDKNSTITAIISSGSSNFTISQNSTIFVLSCGESSIGTIVNSTVTYGLTLTGNSILTIRGSNNIKSISVMGSNSVDYSLKIYNSSIEVLDAICWQLLF